MRNILIIIALLCIISCVDEPDYANPAQKHIEEYSTELKKCKDQQKPQSNVTTTSKDSPKNIIITKAVIEPAPSDIIVNSDVDFAELATKQHTVVVIEYFSPTCPHCAYYQKEIMPKIKSKYVDNNKIIYIVREFIGNKLDLDAAVLARCGNTKDHFFKFMELLLAQQDTWSTNKHYREMLINIGKIGGITQDAYEKCLNDNALVSLLIENTKLAVRSTKFNGTPAFFINGEQLTDPYSVEGLSKAIDSALAKTADAN